MPSEHPLASLEDVRAALAAGAVVLDLRPPVASELVNGAFQQIIGSICVPWDRASQSLETKGLPADTTILAVCRSGSRAGKAVGFLNSAGFTHVLNAGGPKAEDGDGPSLWAELCSTRGCITAPLAGLYQSFDDSAGSSTLTYFLVDDATKEAILIDPVLEHVDRDLQTLESLGCRPVLAFNTHCHADHITATGVLKARVPGLQSVISERSGAKADILVHDGQQVQWASGRRTLRVLATPGHTNGCCSYYEADLGAVFTGDTLLIGGCGRTDFQEGSAATLFESVHSKLFTLPETTLVYPAHDYKGLRCSSIAKEKATNPRLTKPKEEFIALMDNLDLPYPKKIDAALPANLACGIQGPA